MVGGDSVADSPGFAVADVVVVDVAGFPCFVVAVDATGAWLEVVEEACLPSVVAGGSLLLDAEIDP